MVLIPGWWSRTAQRRGPGVRRPIRPGRSGGRTGPGAPQDLHPGQPGARPEEEAAGLPISWSVDGGDGELDSTVQKIADNVLTAAGPGKIIRLDCSGKYTAGVLPYILEGLIAKGYEPAALQSLLLPSPCTVDGEGCQRPAK